MKASSRSLYHVASSQTMYGIFGSLHQGLGERAGTSKGMKRSGEIAVLTNEGPFLLYSASPGSLLSHLSAHVYEVGGAVSGRGKYERVVPACSQSAA